MGLFKKQTQSSGGIDYTTTTINEVDGWVAAQYGNMSIKITSGTLATSTDNSNTFPTTLATAVADDVNNVYLYKNGNILLCTNDNKLYFTTMSLPALIEKTVLDTDGITAYTPHTPSNASYPGRYFSSTKQFSVNDNTNMHVWGNYCNVNGGAAPTAIYYTLDYGITTKVAYKFGQNLVYRDDGTSDGGGTGTLLGDATNTDWITRHTHAVEYDSENDKWYCLTGDTHWTFTTPNMEEIQWMQGTYNDVADSWSWTGLDFGEVIEQQDRLKATECFFHDGYVYWSVDATNVAADNTENGVWRSLISTFTDKDTHQKLFSMPNYDDVITTLKLDLNTNMIVGAFATNGTSPTNGIYAARDFGAGEVQYHFVSTSYNLVRLNSINDEGYFRYDTEVISELHAKTLFIKIGEDLFDNL